MCTLTPSKSGRKGKKKADGGLRGGVVWGGQGFGLKEGDGGKVWLATGCDGEKPLRLWGVSSKEGNGNRSLLVKRWLLPMFEK